MEARGRSFVKKSPGLGEVQAVGTRTGPHGVSLVSSGLCDLDEIIGGGISVGGILMIMEDLDAPHHILLMRYFMAQGLAHGQPLLFASPLSSPKSFLGTLPGLAGGEEQRNSRNTPEAGSQVEDLRIAWQYRRYLNEQQDLANRRLQQQAIAQSQSRISSKFVEQQLLSSDYTAKLDLRKPMERARLTAGNIECMSLCGGINLALLQERCATFFGSLTRVEAQHHVGRIALQSLCAPECMLSLSDWEILGFLHWLKSRLRKVKAVALISFPALLLKPSLCARWQHLADVLLSIEAVRDEDKAMESTLMGYRDIVGFLRVHKLSSINTQVPAVPEVGPFAIKVLQKKKTVLERLHLAPIDASGRKSAGTVGLLCAKPANASSALDF